MHRTPLMIALVAAAGLCTGISRGAEPCKSGLQPGDKITTIFEPLNVTGEHAGEPHCLICEYGLDPVVMMFAREIDEPALRLISKIDTFIQKDREERSKSRLLGMDEEKSLHGALFVADQRVRSAEKSLQSARVLAEKKIVTAAQVKSTEDDLSAAEKQRDEAQTALEKYRESRKKEALYRDLNAFVVFLSDDVNLPEKLKAGATERGVKHVVLSVDRPAGPEGFHISPDAELTVVLYREHEVKANHAFRPGELTDQAVEKVLADLPKVLAR